MHLLFTDVLTVAQVAVVSYQTTPQTGARRTRMQLTKVVITSALVIAACAEGLHDSKGCVEITCAVCTK